MKIVLKNISKKYGEIEAVNNVSLTIEDGKFVSFLGSSGCGKTTLLRIIAGLETADSGEIYFNDQCIFSKEQKVNISVQKRNLGFVFQDFALWPHLTVYENVAFPLKARKNHENIKEKVMKALKMVRLEEFSKRFPSQLSGGQQQRVAFARAIVGEPEIILFDEPLSALDAVLREEMRSEIKKVTRKLGITSVFVTHDQFEAMKMSDEIAVIDKGRIQQYGTPEEIYNHPCEGFVSSFIGKFNYLSDSRKFRPESISFVQIEDAEKCNMIVTGCDFIGGGYEITAKYHENKWSAVSQKKLKIGDSVTVYIDHNKILDEEGEMRV